MSEISQEKGSESKENINSTLSTSDFSMNTTNSVHNKKNAKRTKIKTNRSKSSLGQKCHKDKSITKF